MARITKHGGASNALTGEGAPRRRSAQSPAEMLRAAGKLGPYDAEPEPAEPDPVTPEPEVAVTPDAGPARPALSASKAEWVTYVAQLTDQPEDSVAAATRAELIEMYGA